MWILCGRRCGPAARLFTKYVCCKEARDSLGSARKGGCYATGWGLGGKSLLAKVPMIPDTPA